TRSSLRGACPILPRCRSPCRRSSSGTAATSASSRARPGGRAPGRSAGRWSTSPPCLSSAPSASMSAVRHDAYGLPITAATADALTTYDRGVRALLGWEADALLLFQAAAALDPGLALAHAGAAICLFLEERFAETRETTEKARAAAASLPER